MLLTDGSNLIDLNYSVKFSTFVKFVYKDEEITSTNGCANEFTPHTKEAKRDPQKLTKTAGLDGKTMSYLTDLLNLSVATIMYGKHYFNPT